MTEPTIPTTSNLDVALTMMRDGRSIIYTGEHRSRFLEEALGIMSSRAGQRPSTADPHATGAPCRP